MSLSQDVVENVANGDDVDTNQYLTFILADEEYGVDILRVQEIKGYDKVTDIPNTPDYMMGVINLRGTIVPIIDLRRRFTLDLLEYGPTTVVIVMKVVTDNGSRVMGIVVDAVSDVYNVAQDDLQPPPDFGTGISVDFVRGLATVGDNMVIILDIDRLLSDDELKSMDLLSK
ncbi:MAG: purine-binding chemotaxis protein CheW [Gammaproteobacteria bacterium]|nr:purine-binding chemotaxis protein CheW [Gammaproteobacteria bacterium]